MQPNNRLNPINTTFNVDRQTPKSSFGQVMSSAMNGIIRTGAAIANAVPGMPAISTAVQAVTQLTGGQATPTIASTRAATIASPGQHGQVNIGDEGSELSGALTQMRQQSSEYLAMQNAMQQESREYNALSNIIKVRHDSAKAAIANIR